MAKRFIFSLQLVLDQRIRIEEQRQLIVAELERQRLVLEDRIRAFQRGIQSAKQDLRDRLCIEQAEGLSQPSAPHHQGISLTDVRMQATASLHLVARAQQAVLELVALHKRLDLARLDLLKAAADRKAVELLKARRLQEWTDAQRRLEHADLDELTVMRHAGRPKNIAEEAA